MTQFRLNQVWSEREVGDWEACVATSYAMGLLYGGVIMPAPYTQAERERLEIRADEPQNLGETDVRSRTLYAVSLRGPSVTTSETAFLSRVGMGFCLTGVGSPVGAQAGTFTHEVFGICINPTTIAVYDPLLPAGAAPVNRTIVQMAAWMNGIAGHQVREVRQGEFVGADAVIEALNGYADGTYIPFEHGKAYQFFGFDPTTGARYSFAWTAPATGNLNVPTEGLVDLKGEGPAYFIPSMYAGQARKNIYLPQQYATPTFPPPAQSGIPEADVALMLRKAKHETAEDLAMKAGIPLLSEYAQKEYP